MNAYEVNFTDKEGVKQGYYINAIKPWTAAHYCLKLHQLPVVLNVEIALLGSNTTWEELAEDGIIEVDD